MTKKLFYEDGYQTTFKATVMECIPYGKDYAVILNQTGFYPEGGGQPSDTGMLDGVEVKGAYIKDGRIEHILDEALPIGKEVRGEIDFKRRFDYMQQHTGEHIIAGLVNKLYGYNNVGFHLGEEYMTADFDGILDEEQLVEIEQLANEVVFQSKLVVAESFKSQDHITQSYRSKIDIPGSVRLVTIEGCDCCACCGIHTRRTSEVGIIKIIEAKKYKSGIRMTVVCGHRALLDYRNRLDKTSKISVMLSAKQEEVIEAVIRQQECIDALKQTLVERTNALFELKAKAYKGRDVGMICRVEDNLNFEELRRLCMAITEQTEARCLVLVEEKGYLNYVLGSRKEDVSNLCKQLNNAFEGKGGGKSICQGTLMTTLETFYTKSSMVLGDDVVFDYPPKMFYNKTIQK